MTASVISFIILISTFFAGATNCPNLPLQVTKKIEQNSFTLIPRNTYAESISTERAREIHSSLCHQENLTLSEKLNCETLRACQGLDCKIEHMGHGTAFLAHKKSLLLTAWHVVFPTHAAPLIFFEQPLAKLSTSELHQKLQVLTPDFLLMNSEGTVVFDTRKNLGKTRYAFWGDPLSTVYQATGKKRGSTYGYFENAASDFVGIELPADLALSSQELSLSSSLNKADLSSSSCLYSAGYPYFNGRFAISAGKHEHFRVMQRKLTSMIDFTLEPMKITTEELLKKTIPEILSFMGYSKELIEQTLAKYDTPTIMNSIHIMLNVQARNMRDQELENHEHVLFFDAPVLPGQSGGPIVDGRGEVVGITTNAFYDKLVTTDNHFATYGAAGIFIGALDFLL